MTDTRGAADAGPLPEVLLDTAPCGFVSFGDDGAIAFVNATLLELLGYERDELLGRHVETILTTAGRIFYQTHLFPLLTLQGRAEEIFLLLRPKGGGELGALVNAVRRPRGAAFASDCVIMPVRERRKYEDELLRARRAAEAAQAELEAASEALQATNEALAMQAEELERQRAAAEEANRAKSDFLAVMSHELRTPLNAIGGYAQLLELGIHGPLTEAQREALGRIERSQRHLLRLINEMLNLARIESGHVEYDLEPLSLAEAVAAVLPMVEPQLAARGIACAADVAPDVMARADRDKLQQVLINLLTNAVKFTPPGGRVTVDSARAAGAGNVVHLRVHDTGIGIPAEKLESIFEPFVQVDAGHTRPSEGTGLGLAISRDLARGMGGDLTAESVVGRGSTFTLTLPVA